jgi:hypothetical protein
LEKRIGFSGSKLGQENGDYKTGEILFKSLKNQIPENTLFNINSIIFNLENNKQEILKKYNCFYNPSLEALCIMIEEVTKYSELSKEIVMNMMEFAQKMSIKNVVLLLDRKNKDYVKILQGMMTVGFVNDNNYKVTKIGGKDYKILKMSLKNVPEEVEEIIF